MCLKKANVCLEVHITNNILIFIKDANDFWEKRRAKNILNVFSGWEEPGAHH